MGRRARNFASGLFAGFLVFGSVGCKSNQSSTPPDKAKPQIMVSASSLSFAATVGGASPPAQTIDIWNGASGVTLNYSLTDDAAWLDINPKSGSSTGEKKAHTAAVDLTGLAEGTHSGVITITDPNAGNSPQKVNVSLSLTRPVVPVISVSPSNLSFTGTAGSSNPAAQTIAVKNGASGGTLNYIISSSDAWLDVNPKNGASSGNDVSHSVSVNTSGLGEGNYTGTITVTDPNAGNNPQTVGVTLALARGAAPKICVIPGTLTFTAQEGGPNPPPQEIEAWNCGDAGTTLNYSIGVNASWLNVSPQGGSSAGNKNKHTVMASIAGLAAGGYGGTISVSDPNSVNSPQSVAVLLNVTRK